MINRLKDLFEEPEEKPPVEDYFEIDGTCGTYYVDRATAQQLAAALGKRWRPRWLRFTDVFGAELRVRTDTIRGILESNSATRRSERAFRRKQRRETKDDGVWDDDIW
jgi:hypothetical protein